jgi:hypothetical protein
VSVLAGAWPASAAVWCGLVPEVNPADHGGDIRRPERVTQAVIGAMGQNPRKGVTHTRDEMLPLASRNPNDGRGGQGPFEMVDLRV